MCNSRRKQLGYGNDCFAIAVVGYRLTMEVDERFIAMIETKFCCK